MKKSLFSIILISQILAHILSAQSAKPMLITDLPNPIFANIIQFLDPNSLESLAQANRAINTAIATIIPNQIQQRAQATSVDTLLVDSIINKDLRTIKFISLTPTIRTQITQDGLEEALVQAAIAGQSFSISILLNQEEIIGKLTCIAAGLALMNAAYKNHPSCINTLLSNNRILMLLTPGKIQQTFWSTAEIGSSECLKVLMSHEKTRNATYSNPETNFIALQKAIAKDHISFIHTLLNYDEILSTIPLEELEILSQKKEISSEIKKILKLAIERKKQ